MWYNSTMSSPLALTPEMQQALSSSGGLPVELMDPATQKVYLLVEKDNQAAAYGEYVERALEEGLADFDAGRFEPWNIEKTIAKARGSLNSKRQ